MHRVKFYNLCQNVFAWVAASHLVTNMIATKKYISLQVWIILFLWMQCSTFLMENILLKCW